MGRIRTIKPEFPHSESIGRLSRDARLLFVQLWTIVDDDGRARAASRMLASLLFPYDDDAPELIDVWLDELEREGCVIRYRHDGTSYIALPNWLKHQKVDHPKPSKIPPPPEGFAKDREASRSVAPDPRTMDHRTDVWVGVRERVSEAFIAAGSINPPDTSWVDLWKARGYDPEICLSVVRANLERNNTIRTLKWFDQPIADAHAAPQGRPRAGPASSRPSKPSHISVIQDDYGHGTAHRDAVGEPAKITPRGSPPGGRRPQGENDPSSRRRDAAAGDRHADREPAFVDDDVGG